jgi:hypothetical protein
MNKSKLLLVLTVFVLSISMIGCSSGGGNNNGNEAPAAQENAAEQPAQEEAAEEPAEEAKPAQSSIETDFPVLADAQNMMETDGTIIYQSNASLQEAFDFYKAELSATGLTENDILTLNEDTMFQLVFTGTEDGRSLVVQTIQLDDTTINVTVRYE